MNGNIASKERRILVVEDAAVIRDLLVAIFASAGYQATAVQDAREAPAVARRIRPHLITLDCGRADRRRTDVLRALAADPTTAPIPVVVISASAVDRGPDDTGPIARTFRKPFDPEAVIQAVNTLAGEAHS
ncbi:MAG: PleD family two-component system response regulator [Chloroflexota bacterium]